MQRTRAGKPTCETPGCMKQPSPSSVCRTTHTQLTTRNSHCLRSSLSATPTTGYGLPTSGKKYRWYTRCKPAGAVLSGQPRCVAPGCQRPASYSLGKKGKRQWCHSHRADGAVQPYARECEHPGCTKQPGYGHRDPVTRKGKARWCSGHKLPGAEDVVTPRCQMPHCDNKARYGGANGDRKKRWCRICADRKPGTYNVARFRTREAAEARQRAGQHVTRTSPCVAQATRIFSGC